MSPRWQFACLLLLCSMAYPLVGRAADPCASPAMYAGNVTIAGRIAVAACTEHRLWYRPFIDVDGRLAGSRVREAETSRLANGQPAWERVIDYWRDGGLLWQTHAASACGTAGAIGAPAWCRGFVVDTPWSAAFVSWVMAKASVPGYRGSASHVQYVRRAYRDPLGNAYRVSYPQTAKPRQGDLLCYVRVPGRVYGFDGVMVQLAGSDGGLNMHCDIVVGIDEGVLYLVGGNVFDGVTMRMLQLDATGRLSQLALRGMDDVECSPDAPATCDMNRQDWVLLLQLRDEQDLLALAQPPAMPFSAAPTAADASQCCTDCTDGAGLQPCPNDEETPAAETPGVEDAQPE